MICAFGTLVKRQFLIKNDPIDFSLLFTELFIKSGNIYLSENYCEKLYEQQY